MKKPDRGPCRLVLGACTAFLLWVTLFAAPPAVHGYVLQGPHILDQMVRTLSTAKTLQVEQTVTIEDPELADHAVILSETLAYGFPDRFRSDTRFAQTQRIALSVPGEHVLIVDGKWQADQPNRFDRYKDLLLLRSRALLHKALLEHGVDVGITSLGRFEDRIVYVIGARYPDDSVSQVWVDKDLFLPLRWLNVAPEDPSAVIEFVYRKWRKTGGLWYPAQIETYLQQRSIRTIQAETIQVDSGLSPDLWNVGHLKSMYPPMVSPDEPQPETEVNEIQEAIESFQNKFKR